MQDLAAFYESEYNVRLRIPEAAKILEGYGKTAAKARQLSINHALDLPYGDESGERLDLFRAPRSDSPLLVFIHGGYWRAGDKTDYSWIAPAYVAKGVSVAVLNYALIPDFPLETLVKQQVRALVWLWDEASKLGFDRNRIVVSGHSAGGHLTGMMLATQWQQWRNDLPTNLVKGGVAISGLFDLEPLRHAAFLKDDLALDAKRAEKMSPALMQTPNRVPMIAAVGRLESDEFHRQGDLIKAARPVGDVQTMSLAGLDHLSICAAFADPEHPLFKSTIRLIRKT